MLDRRVVVPLAVPLVGALLATLAACGGEQSEARADRQSPSASPTATAATETPRIRRYVALGDSFTAAPGVPGARSDDGCLRSSANYPHLLTRLVQVEELVDVSCGGADTADLTAAQRTSEGRVRPQLAALTPSTDLVTLGIGGNDGQLFGSFIGACVRAHAATIPGAPCTARLRPGLDNKIARIERSVTMVIERIRATAPSARVVVVGYPQLVPASGTCSELPFPPGDYPFARRINEEMTRAVERAAAATDVEYLDLLGPSEGHDVCSEDPWVNGFSGPGAAPFHPFAVEQAYVAERLAELVAAS